MLSRPSTISRRFVIVMGVSGSGKTTIGEKVATRLRWRYLEADDFHSEANKVKMSAGFPLDDADRIPWLTALRAAMDSCLVRRESAVVTCSALKERYRERLLGGLPEESALLVHLHGDEKLLRERLRERPGHFMKENMLLSQLATLEPPRHALELDIAEDPDQLVDRIVDAVRM